jgi:Flp pilus assembly pilin Flp
MVRIGSRRLKFERNKWGRLTFRVLRDSRGMESVEVALSIALIAAIAGFGMLFLGNSLSNWFYHAGTQLSVGTQFPSQTCTTPPC